MSKSDLPHQTGGVPVLAPSAKRHPDFGQSALARHFGLYGKTSVTAYDACEMLFSEGDNADWLYEVVEGCIFTYKIIIDGRRQITGFHFPGDMLGLHIRGLYVFGAETVTCARLRRYAHGEIAYFAARNPDIAQYLLGLAEDELTEAQNQMLLLGRKSAQERFASFLLLMAERAEQRGERENLATLPMKQMHIADYLGLSAETVSRAMSQLRNAGCIASVEGHGVEIRDINMLTRIASGIEPSLPRSVA